MMNLYNRYPVLDMHGFDRDYARIMIKDFILDCVSMKVEKAIIIHGIGSGVLQKTTHEVLRHNPYVNEFKIDIFNAGQTIVSFSLKKGR